MSKEYFEQLFNLLEIPYTPDQIDSCVKEAKDQINKYFLAAKDGMPVVVCTENGITTVRAPNANCKLEHEYEVVNEGRGVAVRRKCDCCGELQYYQRVYAGKKLFKVIISCTCYDKERDKWLAKMKKKGITLVYGEKDEPNE